MNAAFKLLLCLCMASATASGRYKRSIEVAGELHLQLIRRVAGIVIAAECKSTSGNLAKTWQNIVVYFCTVVCIHKGRCAQLSVFAQYRYIFVNGHVATVEALRFLSHQRNILKRSNALNDAASQTSVKPVWELGISFSRRFVLRL